MGQRKLPAHGSHCGRYPTQPPVHERLSLWKQDAEQLEIVRIEATGCFGVPLIADLECSHAILSMLYRACPTFDTGLYVAVR